MFYFPTYVINALVFSTWGQKSSTTSCQTENFIKTDAVTHIVNDIYFIYRIILYSFTVAVADYTLCTGFKINFY